MTASRHPIRRAHGVRGMILMMGLVALISAGHGASAPARTFELPADDASVTLKRFSEQSGEQIVYPVDRVRGVRTNPVTGEWSPRAALERMLAGTELRVVQDGDTGALAVRREPVASRARGVARAGMNARGTIEGRVFNATSDQYVNNARVTIAPHRLEAFTDQHGRFRFTNVPAGETTLRFFYTGFPVGEQKLQMIGGQTFTQDFTLRLTSTSGPETTVTLDAFTVAANRDMAASDLAVNEQRFASSIKNVVSTDSFGDIAEGNVGEFVKFLPGVTLYRDGSDGRSISLGGVPPNGTPILIDGHGIASAASSNPERTIELEQISINNVSRVEITRSQNPDTPANAIGGTVNLVSKSAFARARPVYAFKAYASFREGDFSLQRQPGPLGDKSHPVQPNFELSAVVPVTRDFGFSVSALSTRTHANGQNITLDWVPHGVPLSANFPATTPDQPYLVRYRISDRPKLSNRESIGISADYRIGEAGVLSLALQYTYFHSAWWGRAVSFEVGRVESFGPDFTQGAPGAGLTRSIYDARDKSGTTFMPTFRYRHRGPVWTWESGGALSRATNHYRDIDQGFWSSNVAAQRRLTVRFEHAGFVRPAAIVVTDAEGAAVDPYSIANYTLESTGSTQSNARDVVSSLYANVARELAWRVPVAVKAGFAWSAQERDIGRSSNSFSHVGADGIPATADDNAAQWFDPAYSRRSLPLGFPPMEWLDLAAIGATYRTQPTHFAQSEAQAAAYHRGIVTSTQSIKETVTAPYVRFDTRLPGDRLSLTWGVRYEHTANEGIGGLVDPSRIYQRDTAGEIVRDSAGQPVAVAPLVSLAGTRLAYVLRGVRSRRSYDNVFPTVNGTFAFRPNLLGRFSYARSIARPRFSVLLPTVNLPDPATENRMLTVTNPDLRPWEADSYGLSLECYFDAPSTGVISLRAYQRDIRDFWQVTTQPVSDELLGYYGIDPRIYSAEQGYSIATRANAGRARVSGVEIDYRQNLAFLPRWARGLTVFGNLTLQHLDGPSLADFSGFVPRTINHGISLSRERFTARVSFNLRGLQRDAAVTHAGAEPGTYTYILPRRSADLTFEYRLTRNFSFFASARNVNGATDDTVDYGPSTPRHSILETRGDYRANWSVGIKGVF